MIIRPMEERDFKSVKEIYELSKLDELRFEQKAFELLSLEKDAKRLGQLLESDIYVYVDLNVVGYGAVYGDEIRGLFVHPLARGKGIGSRLLEHLLACTVHPAKLYIAKTNLPARNLYERYGFRVSSEFETQYNGIAVSANEMVREGRA